MSIQITILELMFYPLPNWMQWGIDGLLAWLTIIFVSITSLERVMQRQMHCKGLIRKTIGAESIQAVGVAAIVGDLVNIEAISCSMQAIESFL